MDVHKLKKDELELLTSGLKENQEVIDKESAIGWDGRNLMVRLPQDVAQFLELNEKNRFKKNLRFIIKHNLEGRIVKEFDVVERQSPKKEVKDGSSKNNKKG